jgi:hypothetical protein
MACLGRHRPELAKTRNGEQSFVDAPLLFWADVSDHFPESACVDCPDLFDEHSRCLPEQIDLRAERGGTGTRGSGRDEDYRPRKELVGLNDHSVSATMLFMASAAGRAELVYVTPEHACSP